MFLILLAAYLLKKVWVRSNKYIMKNYWLDVEIRWCFSKLLEDSEEIWVLTEKTKEFIKMTKLDKVYFKEKNEKLLVKGK